MRSIERNTPVYVHTGVLDMRVSYDRLATKIQEELQLSALRGGLFVFFSRTRDRVRLFYWDRDGYAMWQKRLEAGVFKVTRVNGYEELSAVDLEALLSGVDLTRIKLQKSAEKGLYSNVSLDT